MNLLLSGTNPNQLTAACDMILTCRTVYAAFFFLFVYLNNMWQNDPIKYENVD